MNSQSLFVDVVAAAAGAEGIREILVDALEQGSLTPEQVVGSPLARGYCPPTEIRRLQDQGHIQTFSKEGQEDISIDDRKPGDALKAMTRMMAEGGWSIKPSDQNSVEAMVEALRNYKTADVKRSATGAGALASRTEAYSGTSQEFHDAVKELAAELGATVGVQDRKDGGTFRAIVAPDGTRIDFPSKFREKYSPTISWRNVSAPNLFDQLGIA